MIPLSCRWALLVLFTVSGTLRGQQPWSATDSPTTQTLWGVAYGNGLFVAVGESGTILTSTYGSTWTARTSGTTRWLLDAAWSPNLKLFAVIGDAGTILTSSDGITWTARTSGTTQRLNSIAWGSNNFLVVGENGTALTSSDALTWVPRATGENGWLRGLAFGTNTFVVTGHDGTILTSSDGGATFQRRASTTTLHLDAAVYHSGELPLPQFHVTGTNFIFASSTGGSGWSVDHSAIADGSEAGITYNGLCSFNGALVIVGDAGRILDEFGRRWPTRDPLATGFRAVAASSSVVVAVGTQGEIAFAPLDPALPHATEIHVSNSPYLGGISTLSVTALRARARRYQWSFDGTPITGATTSSLTLSSLTAAQSGTYSVTTTFDVGFSTAEVEFIPRTNPSTLNLVDLTFRPTLTALPSAVLPLADGRVYVAGPEISFPINGRQVEGPARLRTDGSLDPTFNIAGGSLPPGYVKAMILQPDGRLVILIRSYNFPPIEHRLVRLNTDGSVDASFRPDDALSPGDNAPLLLADGRWLALASGTDSDGNRNISVKRFRSDGSVDLAFETHTLAPPDPSRAKRYFEPGLSTMDATGRIYVTGVHEGVDLYPFGAAFTGISQLYRLNADGTRDSGFSVFSVPYSQLTALQATGRGVFAASETRTWQRPSIYHDTKRLFRLNFDGTNDTSFETILDDELSSNSYGNFIGPRQAVALPDGRVVVNAVNWAGHSGFVRLDADGKLDRNFAAEIDYSIQPQGNYPVPVLSEVPLPNGQLLVRGSFTQLNGVEQAYLARLTPNTHASTTALSNLSIRARVGPDPLIVGFVTTNGTKRLFVRGIGPELATFGVTGWLADPQLTLYAGTQASLSNDDWDAALIPTAAALGAFPLSVGSHDAATVAVLPSGAYSMLITGNNAATGIALAEFYDSDAPPTDWTSPRLINLSVRTRAGTGADTLTAGFTIAGDNTRSLLIRGVGPSLAQFGVTGVLADPILTVFHGSTPIATNDNWRTINGIAANFHTAGAFVLTDENDAALLLTLTPGSYTVQLTGKAGGTGVALVEIYEVP